ncbi:hypothetical protein AN1V17_03700 [Vallitalea sediminicola]
MLTYLPQIYPNELLYSTIARYYHHRGSRLLIYFYIKKEVKSNAEKTSIGFFSAIYSQPSL